MAKILLKKKTKIDLYFLKVIMVRTVRHFVKGQTNLAMEHTNRQIEGPDFDPHELGQIIFTKGTKIMQWRMESHFNKCF